ncbi:MAG: hypothetical protein A3K10_05330 [Bacteroidetes bacterium RIFCSPLOWO2_12_FULL_31_6]|nr:MAG: hypothetical protein A3K10_05330 [Bacteroidetes bacterium RIFCSPLOWO2_12_FULL_31_6]
MKFKIILSAFLLLIYSFSFGQESKLKQFMKLSCPEKWWVVGHPFVAKKALKISEYARAITEEVKENGLLKGEGNGDQLDAFRHTFWMANLTLEIGGRRAKKLGKAHEKGNYQDFKKHQLEDGILPDKVSSEMDLYNNDVGIAIGKQSSSFELKNIVIELVLQGNCKIIKTDKKGNFLDAEGNIIPTENLKGKWENEKCLVSSNEVK